MATLPALQPGSATRPPTSMYRSRTGTPAGAINMTGNTALLGNDPGISAIDQADALYRSDNPLLQSARGRAANYAAARGAGVDSASYAYNAELGMGQILLPLAQQDAETQLALQQGNQDALNRMALAQEQSRATLGAANISRASVMDRIREDQRQFDQDQENRAQDREWQLADQDTQARAAARSQFFSGLYQTIFSDPAYWRDAEGAMGLLDTYGKNWDAWFDEMFPEYTENGPNNVPAGGGP